MAAIQHNKHKEVEATQEGQQSESELTKQMLEATSPDAVFGEPIEVQGQTLIPVSEVVAAMGSGKFFRAGGEGGTSTGRAIGVIHVSEKGVDFQPTVDVTKIMLVFITTITTMVITWLRVRRVITKN